MTPSLSTPAHLTPREFALLKILLSTAGRIVKTGTLCREARLTRGSIKTHISHLRSKLGDELIKSDTTRKPFWRYIQSRPWIGYSLEVND